MKVKSLYFGVIAELRGASQEELHVETPTLFELKNHLIEITPGLADVNFQLAVNQKMATENQVLEEGSEISFFPPFAGG